MKFYLTLTDDQGIVLDRFRLEIVGNPADDCVGEDSESLHPMARKDLIDRLNRAAQHALKAEAKAQEVTK